MNSNLTPYENLILMLDYKEVSENNPSVVYSIIHGEEEVTVDLEYAEIEFVFNNKTGRLVYINNYKL